MDRPSASVTWLGHATVLVDLGGMRVLTDPVLRGRIAHLRRHAPVPETPARLDAVLVSHLHRDHADGPSLRRLPADVPVVVPRGCAASVSRLAAGAVVELVEGERLPLAGGAVLAVHADHDGRRSPIHPARAALGFVIERGPLRVWFAGDTGLFDGMRELGPLDAAIVPIWGWGPSLGPGHLDPDEAAQAVALAQPRRAIPIHWGTYLPLGYARGHPLLREPADRFAAAVRRLAPEVEVTIAAQGDPVVLA